MFESVIIGSEKFFSVSLTHDYNIFVIFHGGGNLDLALESRFSKIVSLDSVVNSLDLSLLLSERWLRTLESKQGTVYIDGV